MATYQGHVRTREDAILLFEACQLDVLPKILRRLSRKERKALIAPGAVFVWDEVEAGIQRWTDGRLWGSIAVSETFIIRREMERKVRRTSVVDGSDALGAEGETNRRGSDPDTPMDEEATDGYIYKTNGLVRRSMTISTSGRQLHLVTYHDPSCAYSPELPTPTSDHFLKHLIEEKIGARLSVAFPNVFNDSKYRHEGAEGGSYGRAPPFMGTHPNVNLPPSLPPPQQSHLPVDPNYLRDISSGRAQVWKDDFMSLCMLLTSFSQTPPIVPPYELHNPQYSRLQQTGASTHPSPFVIPQQIPQPGVCPFPSPPRSPNSFVTPHRQAPITKAVIPPVGMHNAQGNSYHQFPPNNMEILPAATRPIKHDIQYPSCPPCSSLPMPGLEPERLSGRQPHHIEPLVQQASLRPAGKFGETRWEDRRERNITHQTIKVHRDDEKIVRSLDRRFLAD
ncbi:hypothetical protein IFR05_005757 [Cadophora sp. M221]|nr:hypothetical protein IFR05_005757 [Cadophora sp. M221]